MSNTKISLFSRPVPKYSNHTVNELLDALKNAESPRSKSPILISLAAMKNEPDGLKRFTFLLEEVKDKDNIQTTEFSTLTVAMIAAIGILKMQNEQYHKSVVDTIRETWNQDAITDFTSILKSENVVIDL